MGGFNAGQFMCYFTSFLDHTLAAAYPLLLIVFAIILYTRKFPKNSDDPSYEDQFPMDEMNQSMNYRNGSRPPSVTVARPAHGSRPPSVQGSRQGGSRPPSSVQGAGGKPPSFFKASRTPSEQGSRAASVAGIYLL